MWCHVDTAKSGVPSAASMLRLGSSFTYICANEGGAEVLSVASLSSVTVRGKLLLRFQSPGLLLFNPSTSRGILQHLASDQLTIIHLTLFAFSPKTVLSVHPFYVRSWPQLNCAKQHSLYHMRQ